MLFELFTPNCRHRKIFVSLIIESCVPCVALKEITLQYRQVFKMRNGNFKYKYSKHNYLDKWVKT